MHRATEKQRELRIRYCNLIHEAILKLSTIDRTLSGDYLLPPRPAYEFCYLQLRLKCELVALGALCVHGDIPATQARTMRKHYAADAILSALEALHPDFFPRPGHVLNHPRGHYEFIPLNMAHLTKAEMIDLYRTCGNILHKGNIKAVTRFDDTDLDFQPIKVYGERFLWLLEEHAISLVQPGHELWVSAKDLDEKRNVSAILVVDD